MISILIYRKFKQLRVGVHGHTWGTRSSSNSAPERGWFIWVSTQIHTKWVASLEVRSSGGILWLKVAKILCKLRLRGAGMEEMRGGRRWSRERRWMSWIGGSRASREKRGVSRANYQNTPPSLYFCVPSLCIFNTASLIRNPNSKPKSDNVALHRLLVPKNIEVRFNNHRLLLRLTT